MQGARRQSSQFLEARIGKNMLSFSSIFNMFSIAKSKFIYILDDLFIIVDLVQSCLLVFFEKEIR